jgi:hypothetical protein
MRQASQVGQNIQGPLPDLPGDLFDLLRDLQCKRPPLGKPLSTPSGASACFKNRVFALIDLENSREPG